MYSKINVFKRVFSIFDLFLLFSWNAILRDIGLNLVKVKI